MSRNKMVVITGTLLESNGAGGHPAGGAKPRHLVAAGGSFGQSSISDLWF